MTVTDYFLRLPEQGYFESTPARILDFLRQPKCGGVDEANGYLSCTGDGAQGGFEVALFRYRDGRPLLAICTNEVEGPDAVFLEFFELGADGRMRLAKRSVFPVKDGTGRSFKLPRHGRTVLVREGGKVVRRLTWDGAKFAEEK